MVKQLENQFEEAHVWSNVNYFALNNRRTKALASQDAHTYTDLCIQLGCPPEDEYLYYQGLAELEFNRVNSQSKRSTYAVKYTTLSDLLPQSPSKFKRAKLRKLADEWDVNVNTIMADYDVKLRILRAAGYAGAWIGKGRKTSLSTASEGRVGSMFKRIYYQSEPKETKK